MSGSQYIYIKARIVEYKEEEEEEEVRKRKGNRGRAVLVWQPISVAPVTQWQQAAPKKDVHNYSNLFKLCIEYRSLEVSSLTSYTRILNDATQLSRMNQVSIEPVGQYTLMQVGMTQKG